MFGLHLCAGAGAKNVRDQIKNCLFLRKPVYKCDEQKLLRLWCMYQLQQ